MCIIQATSLMEAKGHEELVQGYLTLARFADSQYKNLTRQMETKIHEEKKQLLLESKVKLRSKSCNLSLGVLNITCLH